MHYVSNPRRSRLVVLCQFSHIGLDDPSTRRYRNGDREGKTASEGETDFRAGDP
jgi:hypothetical protein